MNQASAIMVYLYVVSCAFLLYLLLHLVYPPNSHANVKSHGSAFLRQGAFVFGVGSFMYSIHEDITGDAHEDSVNHMIHKRYSEHYHAGHAHIEHFTPESCMEMYHDDDDQGQFTIPLRIHHRVLPGWRNCLLQTLLLEHYVEASY
jgi:hypothetical protein